MVGFQLLPKITGPAGPGGGPGRDLGTGGACGACQPGTHVCCSAIVVVPGVPAQPGSPPVDNVLFQLPQPPNSPIATGTYLMRVRIDGAESRLQVDLNQNSPTYLQYVGPTLTVP